MSPEDYIRELQLAIRANHGCEARHLGAWFVPQVEGEKRPWDGAVEIFLLLGHPQAMRCYAWGYEEEEGRLQATTVLEVPPVDSPEGAVRCALRAERTNDE